MHWDVDGYGIVYCCMCGGDYHETAGDGGTIERENEWNEHREIGVLWFGGSV